MNKSREIAMASIVFIFMAGIGARADTQPLSTAQGSNDLGLVFSAANLLLGLEGYQAGLGGKIGWGKLSLRVAFDFVLNGSSNSYSINAGATGEYHLAPGPVSPYIGAFAQFGYMYQGNLSSAVPFSLGAVAGVEVFIFDFLSVFAEYTLAFDFTVTNDFQTSQTTFDYLVDTRMGNGSKLGIVLYFMRIGEKK